MTKIRADHSVFPIVDKWPCWTAWGVQHVALIRWGRGRFVSAEEDIAPLYRLLALGFLATTPGSQELGTHSIMAIRQRMDMLDMVRAESPEKANAVRVVDGANQREFSGSFAEVVAEVEEWPLILAATCEEIR